MNTTEKKTGLPVQRVPCYLSVWRGEWPLGGAPSAVLWNRVGGGAAITTKKKRDVVANFLHRLIVITQVMWEVTQNSVSVRAGHGK